MSTSVTRIHKLSEAKEAFLHDANQQLALFDTHNKFEDMHWHIRLGNSQVIHDFTPYTKDYTQFRPSLNAEFAGEKINLSIAEWAKLITIKVLRGKTSHASHKGLQESVLMLFMLLKEQGTDTLNESQMQEYFTLLMLFDAREGRLCKRLNASSYQTRLVHVLAALTDLVHLANALNIASPIPEISRAKYNKLLDETCLATLDMSLRDFEKGGSFNFLTLDVGRHYIDFCATKFETYWHYIAVWSDIIEDEDLFEEIVRADTELKQRKQVAGKVGKGYLKSFMAQTLMGVLPQDFTFTQSGFLIDRCVSCYDIVVKAFCERFNAIIEQSVAFTEETLKTIASYCHLDSARFDTHEFIRVMQYTRLFEDDTKPRNDIFEEYQSSQSSNYLFNRLTLSEFDAVCKDVTVRNPLTVDNVSKVLAQVNSCLINQAGVVSDKPVVILRRLIDDVHASGVTALLAYTGWRQSEYDFPLSALKTSANIDTLDSNYLPLRHYIKWNVQKTSGKTLLEREVTLSSVILIRQISEIIKSSLALIPDSQIRRDFIYIFVQKNWRAFVYNYQLFVDIDRYEELLRLKDEDVISETLQQELIGLAGQFGENSATRNVKSLKKVLCESQPLLDVFGRSRGKRSLNVLIEYINNELVANKTRLLDKHLSPETKAHLVEEYKASGTLSQSTVRNTRSELQDGLYYPTPHAFRHMWAEAVLRRYRGNIGKFIRANFKHIDERFFAAYLRDKETKVVYQVATRTVISDIVRERIETLSGDERREFAGKFDRYMSKAVKYTEVKTQAEYEKLTNAVCEKVISIKANPWSTCILRKGAERQAKCSENGVPQRYRASPEFCLGCTNADITGANVPGIVAFVKIDVDACTNPELPLFIKLPHLTVVRNALTRITELKRNEKTNKYDKVIEHLNDAIQIVEQQIQQGVA